MFKKYTIATNLSPDEVLARITELINPPGGKRTRVNDEKFPLIYSGRVKRNDVFVVRRFVDYKSITLPSITGRVFSSDKHTLVSLKMRLIWMDSILFFIWVGTGGLAASYCIYEAVSHPGELLKDNNLLLALIPVVISLFGTFLYFRDFRKETDTDR